MTAAVILAAGASRRLGRPKQTVVLAGETLVERAVRVAKEAGSSPVIVVLRDDALFDRLSAVGAIGLQNPRSSEGMATSIVTGVQWAADHGVEGLLILTCDQPGLTAEHLRALCAEPDRITGSAYGGKVGVPAYFPASAFSELLQLQGDTGARQLLQSASAVLCEALALDIDTEADFQRAKERWDPKN